jgi:hypothetical protein
MICCHRRTQQQVIPRQIQISLQSNGSSRRRLNLAGLVGGKQFKARAQLRQYGDPEFIAGLG